MFSVTIVQHTAVTTIYLYHCLSDWTTRQQRGVWEPESQSKGVDLETSLVNPEKAFERCWLRVQVRTECSHHEAACFSTNTTNDDGP